MYPSRALVAAAIAVIGTVHAGTVHAEPFDRAKDYFDEGKKLRDQGKCPLAIMQFELSVKERPSIGAYYNLGHCYDQMADRKAEAYFNYKRAQTMARESRDDRSQEISHALTNIEESAHFLRLVVTQRPEGLAITVDGVAVPSSVYDAEVVVFPKKDKPPHTVTATAPGYVNAQLTAASAREPITIALQRAGEITTQVTSETSAPVMWSRQRWAGAGVAIAGVAVAGIASTLIYVSHINTLDALEAKGHEPNADLNGTNGINPQITAENNAVAVRFVVANGIALALVGVGVALFATAPARASSRAAQVQLLPSVGPRGGGLGIYGVF